MKLRIVGPALSAALLLTACGAKTTSALAPAPTTPPSPSLSTFLANGFIYIPLVEESDSIAGDNDLCHRAFATIIGTQVPVLDRDGKPIGYGQVNDPFYDKTTSMCASQWIATELPATGQVYSYQIGDSKPILFNEEDAPHLSVKFPDPGDPDPYNLNSNLGN